ncbi:hypothetical protein BV22DRAFT_1049162 [Leucogyrophana mollusca]|uniref:Uncharacterized protein n=1 Tax=Leucogyrophana mollusca TaxID=85980 RepID=A0ACB8BBA9_9AGAM|nr:hypothetical protein BV22DRAFT_1049162 [Leucogyrophana mollusca]
MDVPHADIALGAADEVAAIGSVRNAQHILSDFSAEGIDGVDVGGTDEVDVGTCGWSDGAGSARWECERIFTARSVCHGELEACELYGVELTCHKTGGARTGEGIHLSAVDLLLSAESAERCDKKLLLIALREEIDALKRCLLQDRSMALPGHAPLPEGGAAKPPSYNPHKDLPTSPRLWSRAPFCGSLGSGVTPVHSTLDSPVAVLGAVPAVAVGRKAGAAGGYQPLLVDGRAHAGINASESNANSPGSALTVRSAATTRWTRGGTTLTLLRLEVGKGRHYLHVLLFLFGAVWKGHQATGAEELTRVRGCVASQTLPGKLESAFWEAFSGSSGSSSMSAGHGHGSGKWDSEKASKVLEGPAVVRVVLWLSSPWWHKPKPVWDEGCGGCVRVAGGGHAELGVCEEVGVGGGVVDVVRDREDEIGVAVDEKAVFTIDLMDRWASTTNTAGV